MYNYNVINFYLIYVAKLLLLSAVCCRVNLNFCQIGQD